MLRLLNGNVELACGSAGRNPCLASCQPTMATLQCRFPPWRLYRSAPTTCRSVLVSTSIWGVFVACDWRRRPPIILDSDGWARESASRILSSTLRWSCRHWWHLHVPLPFLEAKSSFHPTASVVAGFSFIKVGALATPSPVLVLCKADASYGFSPWVV
jgi:hypothetical protein